MRTPEAMRLEGARKLADQRKVHRQAKKHVKELYGSNPLNRAKQKVADRTNLAWQRARAHPVRTAAKAAMYGAALVAAPVGLPLTAAALGVHYGIGKARQAKHERPHRKEERKASLRMAEREIKRENKKKAQFEEGLLSPEAKAQGGQQTAAPGRNRRMRTWISKRNRPRRTQNP
jgi:hypothetical protein